MPTGYSVFHHLDITGYAGTEVQKYEYSTARISFCSIKTGYGLLVRLSFLSVFLSPFSTGLKSERILPAITRPRCRLKLGLRTVGGNGSSLLRWARDVCEIGDHQANLWAATVTTHLLLLRLSGYRSQEMRFRRDQHFMRRCRSLIFS